MTAGAFNTVISSVDWKNDTAAGELTIEKMSSGEFRFASAGEPNGFVYVKDEPDGVFAKLHALIEALS